MSNYPEMGEKVRPLNAAEKLAIAALKRLAKRWPKSLWLYSGSGSLFVMQQSEDGGQATLTNDGVDPDYIVTSISGIPNDGGDW